MKKILAAFCLPLLASFLCGCAYLGGDCADSTRIELSIRPDYFSPFVRASYCWEYTVKGKKKPLRAVMQLRDDEARVLDEFTFMVPETEKNGELYFAVITAFGSSSTALAFAHRDRGQGGADEKRGVIKFNLGVSHPSPLPDGIPLDEDIVLLTFHQFHLQIPEGVSQPAAFQEGFTTIEIYDEDRDKSHASLVLRFSELSQEELNGAGIISIAPASPTH